MKTFAPPPAVLESLEPRFAPAGVVALNLTAAGALTINGDALDNDFIITENGNDWTITGLDGSTTLFSLNGGAEQTSLTFAAPNSVKANLGDGHDEMILDGVLIPKTLNVTGGNGNDILDLTSVSIGGTVRVNLGNGNDLFTAGGDLFFAKGMNVNLGSGADTFDVNAVTLISDGNILATSSGTALENQDFVLKTGEGEVNGSVTLRTTGQSFTDFEIGEFVDDFLFVSKGLTLQSGIGDDIVVLKGDIQTGGLFSLRLGNGNNAVGTEGMDQLAVRGMTYRGGSGSDSFLLDAREVIIDGTLTFVGGAGANYFDAFATEYFGVAKNLTYSGGSGVDELVLGGPELVVTGNVSMTAGSGTSNLLAINSVLADIGSLRFSAGAGNDRVDIGEAEGGSELVTIYGNTSLNLGGGTADVQILFSDLRGNLSISTAAAFGFADEVRLYSSDFRGNVNINMRGSADSYVEVNDGKFDRNVSISTGAGFDYVEVNDGVFDRNVTISTGAGFDEVRFDTALESSIYSWWDGYVRVNLGSGDDVFYAGSNPAVETVGNDFNWYVDIYGGSGFDTAYFIDPAYNNGFNAGAPWLFSIEDYA